jgi:hypothetical protein
MQRQALVGLSCVLSLVLGACERIAGLDGKQFPEGSQRPSGGTPSSGNTSSGGTSPTAGQDSGGTSSGRGGGNAADGPGGSGTAGSSGAEGGNGNAGGGGDGGTGASSGACENVTEKLCMRPTWPDGVVPYVASDNLPAFLEGLVEDAIAPWEGMRIGSTELHFVNRSSQDFPTLVFSFEKGCGPVRVTDESVTLAFDSCKGYGVARAVGVALGLPRMHQRADRDRYLLMADRDDFDCTRSDIYEKCPDLGDIPAALGPFDTKTLMSAPGVDHETCLRDEPNYPFLYVPRGTFREPFLQCEWVYQDWSSTYRETGQLAELYAIPHGWRPATLMGVDQGSLNPLGLELAPGIELSDSFSLVTLEDRRMALFALDYTSSGTDPDPRPKHIWMLDIAEAYGPYGYGCCWEQLPLPPVPANYGRLTAWRRPGEPNVVDFLFITHGKFREDTFEPSTELFHASYDLATHEVTEWMPLEPPFGPAPPYPIAFTADVSGSLLIYAHDPSPGGSDPLRFETYVLEWDFAATPEWRPLPTLTSSEPLQTLSVKIAEGEHHLVATTANELVYASRAQSGDWSAWSSLASVETAPQPFDLSGVSFVSSKSHELALVGSGGGHFWFWACNDRPCNAPNAWSQPVVYRTTAGEPVIIGASVSTDHHELGMILSLGSYTAFYACRIGPCDDPSAWSDPIVIGPSSHGSLAAVGWSDSIDLFTFDTEDRPPAQWRLGGVWHKRWNAPSP